MSQFGRPRSDVSAGTWSGVGSGTGLFGRINEVTPDDANYIQSATSPVNDTCEVALTDGSNTLTDPVSSTGHVVRYRYHKSASAGKQIDLTVQLRQGAGTVIASQAHTNISNVVTAGSFTLTGPQADAITNYNDLRLRFIANGVGGGSGREGRVTWAEFEIPDAAAAAAAARLALLGVGR